MSPEELSPFRDHFLSVSPSERRSAVYRYMWQTLDQYRSGEIAYDAVRASRNMILELLWEGSLEPANIDFIVHPSFRSDLSDLKSVLEMSTHPDSGRLIDFIESRLDPQTPFYTQVKKACDDIRGAIATLRPSAQ